MSATSSGDNSTTTATSVVPREEHEGAVAAQEELHRGSHAPLAVAETPSPVVAALDSTHELVSPSRHRPRTKCGADAASTGSAREMSDFSNPSSALDDDLEVVDSPYCSPTTLKEHNTIPTGDDASGIIPVSPTDGGLLPAGTTALREVTEGWKRRVAHCLGSHPCMVRVREVIQVAVPRGGLVANVYNLASATLGAGIVSVPSGFHDSGILVAVVLLLVVCVCTIYSLRLLALAADKTGLRSYEEMARGLLGHGWDYFTAFLMFVFGWGTCVGYVISVGDILTAMLDSPNTSPFLRSESGRRTLTSIVWLVGMFTLSLPKEINSLRLASVVGVCFVVFFVMCVVAHALHNGLQGGLRDDLILANSGMEAVNGLSLFIFAFLNQVNQPEIYAEMRRPSPRKMTRDAAVSMSLVLLLNFLSGFFGYCDFGDAVTGSILLLYKPRENAMFMLSYVGLCIKLCVGFAICMQPTRDAVYYCLGWGKTSDVKDWVNWLVSGFLALTALICGLFIPNISIVFSFLGGFTGGFLGFMFPAYFYMYAGGFTLKNVGIWNYIGCVVLLIGGVVAVVFGTAVAIYSEVNA